MHPQFRLLLLILILFSAGRSLAQGDSLRQDARGRYFFSHNAVVPGVGKDVLYERLKSFVTEELNASDTHIRWDEAGKDSVSTIAFIELGNGPLMVNQLVTCKALLRFTDGQAGLQLSNFIYSGRRADSAVSYTRALHRLPLPFSAQTYALVALQETLRQLMVRMDALAIGELSGRERVPARRGR